METWSSLHLLNRSKGNILTRKLLHTVNVPRLTCILHCCYSSACNLSCSLPTPTHTHTHPSLLWKRNMIIVVSSLYLSLLHICSPPFFWRRHMIHRETGDDLNHFEYLLLWDVWRPMGSSGFTSASFSEDAIKGRNKQMMLMLMLPQKLVWRKRDPSSQKHVCLLAQVKIIWT